MSQASNLTSGFPGSGTLEFSKMTDKGRCYHLSVFNAQESDRRLTVTADHGECHVYKGRAQATCGCKLLNGAYCFENWGFNRSSPTKFSSWRHICARGLHSDNTNNFMES